MPTLRSGSSRRRRRRASDDSHRVERRAWEQTVQRRRSDGHRRALGEEKLYAAKYKIAEMERTKRATSSSELGLSNCLSLLGTEAATYRAVCKPGRVDYAKCQVDGVTNGVWIAGEQLTLTVTRMDRFGNRITRREGLAPFFGKAIGPGEVTSQSVELGNGTAEIKLYGTVSGTYQLGVYVADTPIVPYANEEAALMEGEQLMLEENKSEHSSKKSANTKADSKLIACAQTPSPVLFVRSRGVTPVRAKQRLAYNPRYSSMVKTWRR